MGLLCRLMDSFSNSVPGLNISRLPDSLDEKVDMQIQLLSNLILSQGRTDSRHNQPLRPPGKGLRQEQEWTTICTEFDF